MWPYLALGGLSFLGAAGIRIHFAIYAITGSFPLSYIESLMGIICMIVGFVSIIALLALIGAVSEKRRKYVVFSIVLLLLFIGFELFVSLYPGIAFLGGLWGNMALLAVYGILRGFALLRTNESLKSPRPGYGSIGFGIYGWSFVTTTILSTIFIAIGVRVTSITMINIAFWLIIIQYFIDVLCFLAIGIKFVQSAFLYPTIAGRAPRVTTTMVTPTTDPGAIPVQTESQDNYQQETMADDTMKTISDE